jgi:hypothetical protein
MQRSKQAFGAAAAASLGAGVGAGAIAYFRFADRSLVAAVAVGVIAAGLVFRSVVTNTPAPSSDKSIARRRHFSRTSLFEILLLLAAAALATVAVILRDWSLLVSVAIFGGLAGTLLLVRRRGAVADE